MRRLSATLAFIFAFLSGPVLFAGNGNISGAVDPKDMQGAAAQLISLRLNALQKELSNGNRASLEIFWQEIAKQGTPLVESIPDNTLYVHVTFLWRAKADEENVLISILEQREIANEQYLARSRMSRLADTDLWFITYRLRNDARFSYQISPNDPLTLLSNIKPDEWGKRRASFQSDPLNPTRFTSRNGESSVVELPNAPPQPWIKPLSGAPTGKLDEQKITSNILNNERKIWVYIPPGYQQTAEPYQLVVFLGGETYTGGIPGPTILDNLQAKGHLPPVVALFIGNVSEAARVRELSNNESFEDFLAKELIPWVRKHYRVTMNPAQTTIVGCSVGGSAATFTGLRHPEIFGNVLSQSGGYQAGQTPRENLKPLLPGQIFEEGVSEYEWLTRQLATQPKLSLRFYIEVGLNEEAGWQFPVPPFAYPSMIASHRHLRDVLQAKGYEVHYHEYNGGHETLSWRGSLADGLIALIGTKVR
jgi:enterochelin esterase family protein